MNTTNTSAIGTGSWRFPGWILIALMALLPALPWLVDLPRFGALQYNDYYGNIAQVIDKDRFTLDPLRWLGIKSNEHTVTIPTLLYALNFGLTGGDNRGLSLLAILLAAGSAFGVATMSARAFGWRLPATAMVAFAAAALLFTPVSVHSYLMGFSGAIWITTNALAVAAMVAATRVQRSDPAVWLLPVVGLGLLGAISYTTNLSLWPGLLVGGALAGLRRVQLAVLAAGAVLVGLGQWWFRTRPANHPQLQDQPGSIVEYLGIYLGWPFTEHLGTAVAIGLVGVGLFAVLTVLAIVARWRTGPQPMVAPFVMLAMYGLGNGLGTAFGRSGFGLGQATSSRYGSLAMLFWLGVIGLVVHAVLRLARALPPLPRAGVRLLPVAAIVLLTISTWQRGAGVRQHYYDQAAWSPVAAIALRHGIVEDEEVLKRVNNAPSQFRGLPWLERMQHVPFTTPRPLRHRVQVDPARLRERADPRVVGNFDGLTTVRADVGRVQAWAFSRDPRAVIGEVLLLDDQGLVRGELALGSPRDDVYRKVDRSQRYCGVRGYAFAGPETGLLRIWIRMVGEDHYSPLAGRHTLTALASR
ncbi:MAG: hypothetical protein IPK26_08725 [Planctomycetes bacterium]|nr:hypothetical protein [Planctomycetota bacterium]